jgi:hypothetical protein
MIPMRMKINNDQEVIINKMFQASEMAPLAIQLDENDSNKKAYKILFKLNEHISDTDIFFEIRLLAEDNLDKSYIRSRSLYIDNLKKDEKKYNAFKNIMKDFNIDIFYVGDFYYEFDNGNYYIDGFKQLAEANTKQVFFEKIRIYVPRWMLIAMSLYIEDITDPYNMIEKEYLFASNEFSNMRFEKVENLKILGTCKTKKDNYISYNTMYELNTGPTFWRFTYEILTEEDLEVKIPIGEEEFKAWYSKYENNYIGTVKEPNNLYCFIVAKNDKNKIVALMTKDEFINKTNLLDPYKIFVEEEEEIEEDNKENIIDESVFDQGASFDFIKEETNKEEES